MKKRWVQIIVAVVVIIVFVLSYIDFSPVSPAPQIRSQTREAQMIEFENPTEPPSAKGPTGPPPEN